MGILVVVWWRLGNIKILQHPDLKYCNNNEISSLFLTKYLFLLMIIRAATPIDINLCNKPSKLYDWHNLKFTWNEL